MAGLLKLALKDPKLKDKELAKPFNYGAPFAMRYRSWLHKTGMTDLRLPVQLTERGKIVYKKDPKLASLEAQWFLQHELVQDPERAEAWHYFAMKFLPAHGSFTADELLDGLTEKLRSHSEMHFGPGSKLNKVIRRKILECYTTDHGLGQLGLLRKEGQRYVRGTVKPKGPWKSIGALTKAFG
jgi:hypothetical protein